MASHDQGLLETRAGTRIATLQVPGGGTVEIRADVGEHPVLGRCDGVLAGERRLAVFEAVRWDDPERIPAMNAPGRLPPGAGSAVLNLIAERCRRPALRYAGPYPTAALFDTLRECFRVVGDPAAAFARFTGDVEARAAFPTTGEEIAVDFAPAPFSRRWTDEVCVQERDGSVEKVYVGTRAYAREVLGARRILDDGDALVCVLVIAGAPWAERLRLARDGSPVGPPRPLPTVDSPALGRPLPDMVARAVGAAVAARAPLLLRGAIAAVCADTPIRWGDPGEDVARFESDAIVVHAAVFDRLADAGAEALMQGICAALEPVLCQAAQARLS